MPEPSVGISEQPRQPPRVAVVVVTYDNLPDTRRCLASLLQLEYPDFSVVVVDNGSTPPEAPRLRAEFGDRISVLRIEENRGYATGANTGIRAALARSPDYVWLLNNDTLVEPSVLAELVDSMESHPAIGLASPVILGSESVDWSEEVWFAGGAVRLARGTVTHLRSLAAEAGPEPVATGFVTGSAMLARSEVFGVIGMLDESLYLFWEDVDFCLRAARAGWGLAVVPAAKIRHRVHGTIGKGRGRYLVERNARIVAGRHASAAELTQLLLITLASGIARAPFAVIGYRSTRETLKGYVAGTVKLSGIVVRRALAHASDRLRRTRSG